MSECLTVTHVQKKFHDQTVLTDISLSVPKGQIYALLGANGAGKTTLLRIITGLLASDSGQVTIAGLPLATNLTKIQQLFSYSAQAATVDNVLTGLENLILVAKLRHLPHPKQLGTDLLTRFKLSDAANKRVAAYSGGMRRRLDLAMSLVGDPALIFLDEPSTGLDPSSRNDLWQTIRDLKQQGKTIFLTTQYLEEADQLADQIGFLREGQIVATGTPAAMKQLAGPAKLQLTFTDTTQFAAATTLLADFQPQVLADLTLTVPLPQQVTTTLTVLAKLQAAQLAPTALTVAAPTLDDVFMQLTQEVPA